MQGCVFAKYPNVSHDGSPRPHLHSKYCHTGLNQCRKMGKDPAACLAEPLPGWPSIGRLTTYPLSPKALDNTLVRAGGGLIDVFEKLANPASSIPKIVVLGGSMTGGGNLYGLPGYLKPGMPGFMGSAAKGDEDNWPRQLEELLTLYYHRRVPITIKAFGATSLSWAAYHLTEVVPLDTNVLIIDYIQNDVRPAFSDLQDGGENGDEKFSVTAESFIKGLHALFGAHNKPPPSVIWYLTFPPMGFQYNNSAAFRNIWAESTNERTMRRVLHHHASLYVELAGHYDHSAILLQNAIWPTAKSGEPSAALRGWSNCCNQNRQLVVDHHPSWLSHKLSADIVFHSWQHMERLANTSRKHLLWMPHNGTVNVASRLRLLSESCVALAQTISARQALASQRKDSQRTSLLASDPRWRLMEEPSASGGAPKPGWVAHGPKSHGAQISFILNCESEKRLGFDYLRSASFSGSASVRVEAFSSIKKMFWDYFDDSETMRQISSMQPSYRSPAVTMRTHWNTTASLVETHVMSIQCFREGMDSSPVRVTLTFNCPDDELPCRFKLISLFTCGGHSIKPHDTPNAGEQPPLSLTRSVAKPLSLPTQHPPVAKRPSTPHGSTAPAALTHHGLHLPHLERG